MKKCQIHALIRGDREVTKGNHAFIVATHTDKKHIHNHIIVSAA